MQPKLTHSLQQQAQVRLTKWKIEKSRILEEQEKQRQDGAALHQVDVPKLLDRLNQAEKVMVLELCSDEPTLM